MMLFSRFVTPMATGAALGSSGARTSGCATSQLVSVHLVRFDDLVLGLGALGAGLGALDLHLERGALCVLLGARRHAARLVCLLYVGIEVYDKVADADIPLVVIVLEVGGVVRGPCSAGRRALPHWRRHARPPPPRAPPHAHTIVALEQEQKIRYYNTFTNTTTIHAHPLDLIRLNGVNEMVLDDMGLLSPTAHGLEIY